MTRLNTLSAAIAAALASFTTQAATLTVDTAEFVVQHNGLCSLPEAINNANNDNDGALDPGTIGDCPAGAGADTIEFDPALAGQTITFTSASPVSTEVSISGAVAPGLTLSGGSSQSMFNVSSTGTLQLGDLVLRDGHPSSTNQGGALTLSNGTITIDRVMFIDNTGRGGRGGAIDMDGGTLTVRDSTFSGNSAVTGGAIRINAATAVTITGSSFVGNTVSQTGGAIRIVQDALEISDSTFSGNTAGSSGGGLYVFGFASATLRQTTFAGNTASSGSALFADATNFVGAATVTLHNSVVTGSGDACVLQTDGSYVATLTGVGNHFEDASCDGVADGNPGLVALATAANGTAFHALTAASPLLDAGDAAECTTADQRGLARPVGACDIGAVEMQASGQAGPDFTVNADGDGGDGFCGDQVGECTLRDAVLAADTHVDASVVDFDAGVIATGATITLTQGELASSTDVTLSGGDRVIARGAGLGACVLDGTAEAHEFRLWQVTGGTLAMSDLTLQGGCADGALDAGDGGALSAFGADLALSNVHLTGNSSRRHGGGLYLAAEDSSATVIENSTFSGNYSLGDGGGAYFRLYSTPTVSATTFSDNTAANGGALAVVGSIALTDALLSNNSAVDDGGGLHLDSYGADASLARVGFVGNSAGRNAGAMYVSTIDSTLTAISDSTFSGNSAVQEGGGLRMSGGVLNLQGTTFSDNSAQIGGGMASSATTSVDDSTFYQNVGTAALAEIAGGSNVSITRSVIASSAASPCSTGMTITDTIATAADCGSSIASLGAMALGPLADNGGPTQTHRPAPGSVLIDTAAGCAATDQRGFTRPVDADGDGGAASCDAGAVEVQNTLPTALDDGADTDQDSLATGNVLDNDSDANDEDAGTLIIVAVDGEAAAVGMPAPLLGDGLLTLNADGSFSFDPNGEFIALAAGETRLTGANYTVSDGIAEVTATIEITVTGLNDAPIAESIVASTSEDGPTGPVAYNASDVDAGDALTFAITTQPTAGVATDLGDGTFSFDPDGDFEALDDGDTQVVSFTCSATDPSMATDSATVQVTVNGVNDAPATGADSYTVTENETLTVDAAAGVLANDSDVEGDALMVVAGTYTPAGIGGTLVLAADGSFEYTPPTDTIGTAAFEYTVSDADATAMALLTIEVEEAATVDLMIDKSDGEAVVAAGQALSYTITLMNAGPADAMGATVQDLVPPELENVSWTCVASGGAACGNGSGNGDIDELVDVPTGGIVDYTLAATVAAGFEADAIINTATVAPPVGLEDSDLSNNSATDIDFAGLVYRDGFEVTPMVKTFAGRRARLEAESLANLAPDGTPSLVLRAQDRGASPLAITLVHARRTGDRLELRISRLEHGNWVIGKWQPVSDRLLEVRW